MRDAPSSDQEAELPGAAAAPSRKALLWIVLPLLAFVGAIALAAGLTAAPALAQTKLTVPGGSTTGTYMDYMKTVYARASGSELLQVPLTSFDNEYQLTPLAAELGWTVRVVDVDAHPELEARWDELVPVVLHGDTELCHYHLDVAAVRAYCARGAQAGA